MIRDIIDDFREIGTGISAWIFYRRHAIKLKLAIRLADIKQKAFNKRYFVMLVETPKGDKLISINNADFETFKRKGWLPRKMSYLQLEHESFYQTALSLNNTHNQEQKKQAKEKYLRYANKYMR